MTSAAQGRVIVGISGSLANLSALHAGVAQARAARAELVLVHAWLPAGGEIAYRRGPCPPLLELARKEAQATLTSAVMDALGGAPPDLDVRFLIVRGETAKVLVAMADRVEDLLVVGTGRHRRLACLRPNSVGRYCFVHAACPVLVAPPPAMIKEVGRAVRSRSCELSSTTRPVTPMS
jgi:nucleotide-binding universal stress UspA family protein